MKMMFSNETDFNIDSYKPLIISAAEKTLECEQFIKNAEISFSLVDEEEIRRLNNEYREIDSVTDVLSFPLLEPEQLDEIAEKSGQPIALGDIVICVKRAQEQAKEYGHSLEREICFLTVHSMLHLLGYDHMQEDEEREMFAKQEEILNLMGLTRDTETYKDKVYEKTNTEDEENKSLIAQARKCMQNSYSPYSNFKVGAAVLAGDGRIFVGCNIENASYPAGICAEQAALSRAIAEGAEDLLKIAVVADHGKAIPCGICRQFMLELMPNGYVIIPYGDGCEKYSIKELLPHSFELDS